MSMNWSELIGQAEEGGTFEAIPEGQYQAIVAEATAKPATSGKPMIVLVFEVQAGPHKGRKVWNNLVITRDNPNALAWFFKHMAALGLNKDFFAHNPSMEAVATQLKGKACTIDVTQKVWNGETRNDVKKISPASSATAAVSPMGPAPTPAATPDTPAPSSPAPSTPF